MSGFPRCLVTPATDWSNTVSVAANSGSLKKAAKNLRISFRIWRRLDEYLWRTNVGDELNDLASEFVSLWTRYQPDVRRYVCMIVPLASDAEDVMQETAKRLWEKFEQYDSQRPFVPWAIGFAYHEILSWRQRQARDRLVFSEEIIAQLHTIIGQEPSVLELRRKALDGCLQKLEPAERDLLLRRYSQHGAIQQEAEKTKISRHKLYYGIEKMRVRLLACIDRKMQQEGWQHG